MAIPAGSAVSGIVTSARRSGKVKGRAYVAMRFSNLTPRGDAESYRMDTRTVGRLAPATKRNDAIKIGAPAAGGAIVGGLVGGGKGAAIGAAAGGGAGTAVVLSTRGKEVRLGRGATVLVRLAQPLHLRVRSYGLRCTVHECAGAQVMRARGTSCTCALVHPNKYA